MAAAQFTFALTIRKSFFFLTTAGLAGLLPAILRGGFVAVFSRPTDWLASATLRLRASGNPIGRCPPLNQPSAGDQPCPRIKSWRTEHGRQHNNQEGHGSKGCLCAPRYWEADCVAWRQPSSPTNSRMILVGPWAQGTARSHAEAIRLLMTQGKNHDNSREA